MSYKIKKEVHEVHTYGFTNTENITVLFQGSDNAKLECRLGDDPDPVNPRSYDKIGTMYCFHKRYDLGDDHGFTVRAFLDWMEEQEKEYKQDFIYEPLYLLDHSGVIISIYPFNDWWDSGQVGYIVAFAPEAAKKIYGIENWEDLPRWKRRRIRQKIRDVLKAEVEEYNDYLQGDYYWYAIEYFCNGKSLECDSLSSIRGREYLTEEFIQSCLAFLKEYSPQDDHKKILEDIVYECEHLSVTVWEKLKRGGIQNGPEET